MLLVSRQLKILKLTVILLSVFEDILNSKYLFEYDGTISQVMVIIYYLPRCSYHLLYRLRRANKKNYLIYGAHNKMIPLGGALGSGHFCYIAKLFLKIKESFKI